MNFMGKLVRSFITPEVPPDTVQEVNLSAYTSIPVSYLTKLQMREIYMLYLVPTFNHCLILINCIL